MNAAFRAFAEFLERGGYLVTVSLLVVCAVMWVVLLARAAALGLAPWEVLLPPGQRKQGAARALFAQAFRAYLSDPGERTRELLLSRSVSLGTPIGLFVRRAFAGAPPSLPPRRTMIDAAVTLGERDAFVGLGLVRALICAALLLGAIGALAGLQVTLDSMTTLGVHGQAAWTTGLGQAFAGAEAAAVVALPGMIAAAWLGHRASRLAREIRARGTQLHHAIPAASEEVA